MSVAVYARIGDTVRPLHLAHDPKKQSTGNKDQKHQKGEKRQDRDQGKEKGDKNRRENPNKR